MAHRGLTLRKFINSIDPDLFERYFDALEADKKPGPWANMNPDELQAFLDQDENAQARAIILEDFRRINDICHRGMNLVVKAYQRSGIAFDAERTSEELAIRLFLDHKEAFDFAWTRYLLYSSSSKATSHEVPVGEWNLDDAQVAAFVSEIRRWFTDLGKGDVCQVRHYEDEGQAIMLVSHGSYMRSVAFWQGSEIRFNSYRPAAEDILAFDPSEGILQIWAAQEKDRRQYLEAFIRRVVGDEGLIEGAAASRIFTLVPIMDHTFDFAGDGDVIMGVDLLKVKLRLFTVGDPVIEVQSGDVMWTFAHDLASIPMDAGEMTFARLRFHIQHLGEKLKKVTFEIQPPARTDLAQKRYADDIERYLRQQGVKLR